jgi:polyhydroxyalkanoate synthesis regulator protein
MKIILYKNKKLYSNGSYLTYVDIVELVKSGQVIKVTDNVTGLDVTDIILRKLVSYLEIPHIECVTLLNNYPIIIN